MVNSAAVVADVSNQVPNSWRITIVGYLLVAVSTQYCFFCMNIYDYIPHFSKDLKTQWSKVSRPKNSRWIYDVTNPLHFFGTFLWGVKLSCRTFWGVNWTTWKCLDDGEKKIQWAKMDTPTLGWVAHFHIHLVGWFGDLKGWRLGRCELEEFLSG